MNIDKLNTRLLHDLAIPLAIGVVATLDLAAWPLVARCEGEQNWNGALFTTVVDELAEILAKRVGHLIAAVGFHLVDVTGVSSTRDDATPFLVVDGADVVMSEL